MKKLLFYFLCSLLLSNPGFARNSIHISHMSIAAQGMGGAFTAYPRDATATLINPALLNRTGMKLTLLSAPIGFSSDLLDMLEFLDTNQEALSNFDSLSLQEQELLYEDARTFDDKWVNLQLTPFAGVTLPRLNFGAAIFSEVNSGIKLDRGIFIPATGVRGYSIEGVGFGIGRRIMEQEIGVAVRFYRKRELAAQRISVDDINNIGNMLETSLDEVKNPETGFGVDIGWISSFGEKLDVAVTIRDFIGSADEWVKPELITGVSYIPVYDDEYPILKRWRIMADINDWFNTDGVSFFQGIDFGTELRLPAMFDFRAGVHQGYPTFGVGLKLLIVRLDYAYFTQEQGFKPGQQPDESHRVGVTIGW